MEEVEELLVFLALVSSFRWNCLGCCCCCCRLGSWDARRGGPVSMVGTEIEEEHRQRARLRKKKVQRKQRVGLPGLAAAAAVKSEAAMRKRRHECESQKMSMTQ